MCIQQYNLWCETVCTNLQHYMDFIHYLDPVVGHQNFIHLASTFSWFCECNKNHTVQERINECLCVKDSHFNIIDHMEVCTQCGVVSNECASDNFDNFIYFYENGSIEQRSYYVAERNFIKFMNKFKYSHTLFCHVGHLRHIEKMVTNTCSETQLFLYMKSKNLQDLYEYIPRLLLQRTDITLLSNEEFNALHQQFLHFTKWYSYHRKNQKRQSLPHRGFLFLKFCELENIHRFHCLVRIPKLVKTIEQLENIWKLYVCYKK